MNRAERRARLFPKLGSSFTERVEDFDWFPLETAAPVAAELPSVQTPDPPEAPPQPPSLPRMVISPVPITYEELRKNVMAYQDALVKVPGWQDLLAAEHLAKKEARRLAKRKRKEMENDNTKNRPA